MSYEKAPRPRTQSRMRELYETIDGLGGATLEEVMKYLPACTKTGKGRTRKDVKKGLYNGVYRGHFIVTPQGQYRIAPIQYYNDRKKYVDDLNKKSYKKRKASKKAQRKQPTGLTVVEETVPNLLKEEVPKLKPQQTYDNVIRPTVQLPEWFWLIPFGSGLVIGSAIAIFVFLSLGG